MKQIFDHATINCTARQKKHWQYLLFYEANKKDQYLLRNTVKALSSICIEVRCRLLNSEGSKIYFILYKRKR